MTGVAEFQDLMRRIYHERDLRRGVNVRAIWLVSELGELMDALVKSDWAALREETADVLAWLCSLCNVLGIDVERAAVQRYGSGCPKCSHMPCSCPDS